MKRILLTVVLALGCAMPQMSKAGFLMAIGSGAIFVGAEYLTHLRKLSGLGTAAALGAVTTLLVANRVASRAQGGDRSNFGEEGLLAMAVGIGGSIARHHLLKVA